MQSRLDDRLAAISGCMQKGKMRKAIQLLLAAPLCGCVATSPRPDAGSSQRAEPIAVSLALEETITIGVRQHLKNPLTARFGPILAGERTVNGSKEIVVCGSVQDKNAAVASAGYEPFLGKIHPDADNSFELVAMGDETSKVADTCRAAGLPIDRPKS